MQGICCVCVTYGVDPIVVCSVYESLSTQIDEFILVNNNDRTEMAEGNVFPGTVIDIGENVGIAKAQNIGIKFALAKGYKYVLLTDQDTLYPDDFVSKMLTAFDYGNSVGVVVPEVFDQIRGRYQGFVHRASFNFKRTAIKCISPVLQANASGMLVKSECFALVGYMREDLFLDWVDLEWCWRFLRSDLVIVAQPAAIIDHYLGDRCVQIGSMRVASRNDQRYYYIIRNGIFLLLRDRNLHFLLKIALLLKIGMYFSGYLYISQRKVRTFRALIKALMHGLIGRLGKYED